MSASIVAQKQSPWNLFSHQNTSLVSCAEDADADIAAFYKAREELLRKSQQK